MTTLVNKDRQAAVTMILRETFKPQFVEVTKAIRAWAEAWVVAKHPRFVVLASDKENHAYMSFNYPRCCAEDVGGEARALVTPDYEKPASKPGGKWLRTDNHAYYISTGDVRVPAGVAEVMIPEHDPAVILHDKVWADFIAARTKLESVFNSYSTREKLQADFPDLAKYLPPIKAKPRLPVVIKDDVNKELAKLGIPPNKVKKGGAS